MRLFEKMLKKIDKEYLLSNNYIPLILKDKEYLKKDYDVLVFECGMCDVIGISIYLEEINKKWFINKCISRDVEQIDLFELFFNDRDIRRLVWFERTNQWMTPTPEEA